MLEPCGIPNKNIRNKKMTEKTLIQLECPLFNSFRVQQVAGMFDVPLSERVSTIIETEPPPVAGTVDETVAGTVDGVVMDWQIGVIVGLSGSGKSTIARHFYGASGVYCTDAVYSDGTDTWANNKAVVDCFADSIPIKDVVSMLTSVGFGSPPSWCKPYQVLSNGEKFRCDLARALLSGNFVVFDEYTSVVDRNIAKIGSAAVAKAIRKSDRKFVAVSCHYDIIDWLTPDWILDTQTGKVVWNRGLLRRPDINLKIHKCHYNDWRLFSKYHYLNSKTLSTSAQCYVAMYNTDGNDIPVSFIAVMQNCGHKNYKRVSRLVTLPDYQGIGIGMTLTHFVADLYKRQGYRFSLGTSHPGMIQSLRNDKRWIYRGTNRAENNLGNTKRTCRLRNNVTIGRMVASFEFIGNHDGKSGKSSL